MHWGMRLKIDWLIRPIFYPLETWTGLKNLKLLWDSYPHLTLGLFFTCFVSPNWPFVLSGLFSSFSLAPSTHNAFNYTAAMVFRVCLATISFWAGNLGFSFFFCSVWFFNVSWKDVCFPIVSASSNRDVSSGVWALFRQNPPMAGLSESSPLQQVFCGLNVAIMLKYASLYFIFTHEKLLRTFFLLRLDVG